MNQVAIVLSVLLSVSSLLAQEAKRNDAMMDCPTMHSQKAAHQAVVESHGDQAMGFPRDKTTHHFQLMPDGGAIEVTANHSGDKENAAAIRSHLMHIAMMFSDGDFSAPMFIHDGIPPGVTTMKVMKGAIHYSYEEAPTGGRLRIKTNDPIAVAAIHDFLRFQIKEHETGDSLEAPQN